MPGGGQIGIVAYGNQNKIFNGNPELTYFYKVFKRFTHFSQENITIKPRLFGHTTIDINRHQKQKRRDNLIIPV